jgi:hypothetical protein
MLPTIERSHGDAYLTRVRQSDLEPVDAEAERSRNQDAKGRAKQGNKLGENRGAKHALTGPLKSITEAVQDAIGGAITPEDSKRVIADALKLYAANRRALGSGKVPVLARLIRVSVNDALATYYTTQAGAAGFATERGLELIDAAHRCENRAERAMTSALAFAKAIGVKAPPEARYAPGFDVEADGEDAT